MQNKQKSTLKPDLIDIMNATKPIVAVLIDKAFIYYDSDGGVLSLTYDEGNEFFADRMKLEANKKRLLEGARQILPALRNISVIVRDKTNSTN